MAENRNVLSGLLIAGPVPRASLVVALAGTRVHRECDVEPRHVVGDVRVEVEEHRARRAHDLGHARHGVAVAADEARVDGAEVGEHLGKEEENTW